MRFPVRVDPFNEGLLHLTDVVHGGGSLHRNIKVPDLQIWSMIETLDDRVEELLVVLR